MLLFFLPALLQLIAMWWCFCSLVKRCYYQSGHGSDFVPWSGIATINRDMVVICSLVKCCYN